MYIQYTYIYIYIHTYMGVYIRMQYVYVHNATTISCNRRLCTVWQQREKRESLSVAQLSH